MENKISLIDCFKKYDEFLLNNISINIKKGYITGFIGNNGAGKSTVISALLSMIKFEGNILYEEKVINDLSYLQDIGVVIDNDLLNKDWDIKTVNKVMKIGYRCWDENQFYNYLERFKINTNNKVKELSSGMYNKLLLAIALSHQASLLILDEPTSGLDVKTRDEFIEIIQEFMEKEGNTVLFSTHITTDLDAIADYIIYIDNGNIIDMCEKDNFISKYCVVKGDINSLEKIDMKNILGIKKNKYNFEGLLTSTYVKNINNDFVIDEANIEKIMMLYGRKE